MQRRSGSDRQYTASNQGRHCSLYICSRFEHDPDQYAASEKRRGWEVEDANFTCLAEGEKLHESEIIS